MNQAPGVIQIEGSPTKLLLLCNLGVLTTLLCVAIAVPLIPGPQPPFYVQVFGYGGALFFALCTALAAKRIFSPGAPVVTIAPDGIRDTRVAAEFIPWSAIQRISAWEYSRQKAIVLAVDPEFERGLTLTRLARWTRSANRSLGADGLCITAQGLKVGHDALAATCIQRFNAWRAKAGASPAS
jgi:hypothetical protein